MSESSASLRPGEWNAMQRRVFFVVGAGFLILLGAAIALAAFDRGRRDTLDQFTFVTASPEYFIAGPALKRGSEVGALRKSPLYVWSLQPIPSSDRQLMPVGRLDDTGILLYQMRSEENRLREDGTSQYFVSISPGRFLELTDFPPSN